MNSTGKYKSKVLRRLQVIPGTGMACSPDLCGGYCATETDHEKEKLNWWYWKDKQYNE